MDISLRACRADAASSTTGLVSQSEFRSAVGNLENAIEGCRAATEKKDDKNNKLAQVVARLEKEKVCGNFERRRRVRHLNRYITCAQTGTDHHISHVEAGLKRVMDDHDDAQKKTIEVSQRQLKRFTELKADVGEPFFFSLPIN